MTKNANWDVIAQEYDKFVGEQGDINHRICINPIIFRFLGKVKGIKVLDLACGQGYLSRILAKMGAHVVGIDNSKNLINLAKIKEEEQCLGIKYFVNDATNLRDIEEMSIDCIVSTMSFHDIKNVSGTIKECSRVLKKKGKLIFTIPHPMRDMLDRDKDNSGYYYKLRGYNSIIESPHPLSKKKWGNERILIYHRPLGYYFKELFGAGFVVSGFNEINAKHKGGKLIKDKKLLKLRKSVPAFLAMECTKIN